jgi:hypothetical protein
MLFACIGWTERLSEFFKLAFGNDPLGGRERVYQSGLDPTNYSFQATGLASKFRDLSQYYLRKGAQQTEATNWRR